MVGKGLRNSGNPPGVLELMWRADGKVLWHSFPDSGISVYVLNEERSNSPDLLDNFLTSWLD